MKNRTIAQYDQMRGLYSWIVSRRHSEVNFSEVYAKLREEMKTATDKSRMQYLLSLSEAHQNAWIYMKTKSRKNRCIAYVNFMDSFAGCIK